MFLLSALFLCVRIFFSSIFFTVVLRVSFARNREKAKKGASAVTECLRFVPPQNAVRSALVLEGSDKSEVNIGEKLKNDIMIYRGLIVYKREDKKKCIKELLDALQQIYNEAKDEIKKYRGHILFAFKESINHMRCFFKNESFACENEYRIVLKIPEELLLAEECSGDIFKKGQFKRGNILIPFVDYKFKSDSIKHIVTNPFIREENSIFELGIRELLWQNKMEDVDIFSSGIPIRKYN